MKREDIVPSQNQVEGGEKGTKNRAGAFAFSKGGAGRGEKHCVKGIKKRVEGAFNPGHKRGNQEGISM